MRAKIVRDQFEVVSAHTQIHIPMQDRSFEGVVVGYVHKKHMHVDLHRV